MFGDEVSSARMQGAREEGAHDEISQDTTASKANEKVVKKDLSDDVEQVNHGERELIDHHRAESVEKDLECSEEGFAEYGVKEKGLE